METQNSKTEITYRRMLESDHPAAYQLSQAVRWPHRLEDWQFLHRVGSGFVAERNGQPIGTALCWSHGDDYGSLGMVIVSPEAQGNGIGGELMNRLLVELGERNTLLCATPAGQPLYERLGFKAIGRIHQHQGTIVQPEVVAPPAGESIRPIESDDCPRLAELAARACGMPRATLLNSLLNVSEGIVLDNDGELTGFALMRRFGRGYVIGPVVALDADRAKAMISYLIGLCVDSFVRIDVPDSCELSPWLNEIGLVQVDTPVVMVRGEPPHADPSMRQFAVSGQAIG
ncbi:N-acetyltransferase [Litchfieldella qijiaojingensis]|uniref:N-acetyltransferase n=1 Tax=Litchfieldella qijiaojingensis TaxID=980347 RepID=A0ABQ2Z2K0_9GAMM|nr:GNAT family N-acetyltransferase [Halomonas qijiaojingensis]GGY01314.1 N-acetyltransferase [Halomonas qijiaojingensis]